MTAVRVRQVLWCLTGCYWVTLAVLTHLPTLNPSTAQEAAYAAVGDKTQHVVAYALLAGMLAAALWLTFPRRPRLASIVSTQVLGPPQWPKTTVEPA